MPTPEQPVDPSKARLQESRKVDQQITIDMGQDIVDLYEDAIIRTKKYTGELVAEVEEGDHVIGIFRGEDRKGRPKVVALDGNKVYKLGVEKYVPVRDIALMVAPDLSRLALTNTHRRDDINVTAHIYPGPEPYARTS